MVLSDQKDLDGAQAALDKATKLKPDFALAWNRLGRVELKRGQLPAAVAAQERALSLSGTHSAYGADLCRAYFEQKNLAKAANMCRAAVTENPKDPLALYEFMKVLVAKGDCADAKSELARFKGLGVKPEAQKQADAIVATCKKK
jgi:tetratricopeptide (TPR) repeat protein